MTKHESRKQRSNLPAMQRSLYLAGILFGYFACEYFFSHMHYIIPAVRVIAIIRMEYDCIYKASFYKVRFMDKMILRGIFVADLFGSLYGRSVGLLAINTTIT
ncbi:hypothetical protein [Porphyromonas pogonae]|uniref:hypothetical protein n=1 Tax=Porphyromonas pogonae TaxID=867595 RepID=UPI002E78C30D|nr:hypothetical protein [Porphyromonas pogonae]